MMESKGETASAQVQELDANNIDHEAEKKLIRKCDIHIVPILFVLFILSFMDRINIGNARIQGLEKDLNMSGHDFNIALFIFFIPYILLEVPSNLILKNVAPSTWLSVIMFGWGVVTVCQGVTESYTGLIVCRCLLGAFEAGFVPGCIYLISMYYKRHELQLRFNFWFSASILAGAFSGLFAYAVANMDGIGGYSGWRWIFIVEGLITVVFAVAAKFLIVDWPETAKFLTEEERALLISRLAGESKDANMSRLDKPALKRSFSDLKIYIGIIMYFGIVNTGYAFSFFTPTILRQLGWTAIHAQVMSIPIFLFATVTTMLTAVLSDRMRHRFGFIIFGCLIASIGYIILLVQERVAIGVRYFSLFTVISGAFIAHPICMTWLLNNMSGHYKRAIGSSMQIGFGNAGGLIASNIFLDNEKPLYRTGFGVSFALMWLAGLMAIVFLFYLRRENRIRERGGRDYLLDLPERELENLGDDHPGFRFTY
ncbi:hypothetical protein AJ80_08343 [Polytolypa hystricis UAMH7299]|uniref:Major facilitator superfamily (MFS) profile domain-containing protein n=1 Tax=Polytolypa hystricis (strain UAMH7299) TaxID=1447883 RepID=A0A2B7X8U2_POLH7|nr:hypothetical protein AJ80_08343 [Polytolypa hystricis UAMH7299]